MTNFERLTKDKNTFADWLAMHVMCKSCPARFGTCQEQTDHYLCRLNWRDWLAEKANPKDALGWSFYDSRHKVRINAREVAEEYTQLNGMPCGELEDVK